MSCAAPPTFRLLDGWVGWDPDPTLGTDAFLGLDGLGEGEALELALVGGGVDPQGLLQYLPPPPLARGCGPCEWYLVTPAPAARALRRDACQGCIPVRGAAGVLGTLVAPVAIAVRRHRIAVADPGAGVVWVVVALGIGVERRHHGRRSRASSRSLPGASCWSSSTVDRRCCASGRRENLAER